MKNVLHSLEIDKLMDGYALPIDVEDAVSFGGKVEREVLAKVSKQEPVDNPNEWIIENLSYHIHERDDMTMDDCLKYLATEWKETHGRTTRQMVMQILSLLAQAAPPQAAAIPEGYVIAPTDPTPTMLDAGVAMALQVSVHGEGGWSKYLTGLYKQMLSAAPKPEGKS